MCIVGYEPDALGRALPLGSASAAPGPHVTQRCAHGALIPPPPRPWPTADWSYACIDYVSRLSDPRNLAAAALYLLLLWLLLAARPWRVLDEWAAAAGRGGSGSSGGGRESTARWRLAVAAGLLVAPFFPASNVPFYVGTFIGERLLYFPSVGYCLLLAQALAAWLPPEQQPLAAAAAGDGGGAKAAGAARLGGRAAAALLTLLLAFYGGRTLVRNQDWWDEERLFRAAQKVRDRGAPSLCTGGGGGGRTPSRLHTAAPHPTTPLVPGVLAQRQGPAEQRGVGAAVPQLGRSRAPF